MAMIAIKCVLLLISYFFGAKGVFAEGGDRNHVLNFFFGEKENIRSDCPSGKLTHDTRNTSVTYIHWGRGDCNTETSTIVYSGYIGGGHFQHSGGGTNALCLPTIPEYDDNLVATSGARAYLYGANLGTKGSNNYLSTDIDGSIPLCAACLVHGRSATLMIPAKLTCPAGWQLEYIGVLEGGGYSHAGAHEYICLDTNPEFGNSSATSEYNGFVLYPTLGRYGSLPCPPYVEGNELSCVVCSW